MAEPNDCMKAAHCDHRDGLRTDKKEHDGSEGMNGRDNGADGWCILRCAPARTLKLAASLDDAGIEAWTPGETQQRRRGRARERVDVEAPIMPTFVFARASHLPAIADVVRAPVSPHPAFSLFRLHGRIPLVAERDIAALRRIEERGRLRQLRGERRVIPIGTEIRMTEGSFAGMAGVVEDGDGKFALVAFGGSFRVKIATFLLRTDEVQQQPAREGVAA